MAHFYRVPWPPVVTMIRIIKMITAITTITMITMIMMTTESLAHMQSNWPCPYLAKPSGLQGDNSETERPADNGDNDDNDDGKSTARIPAF